MRAILNQHFNKIGISYNIRLRKSESKTKSDFGSAYLQFIQGRKTLRITLGIEWPLQKFDTAHNLFLPRYTGDLEVNDRNLEAQHCLAKVSDLMVGYRLGEAQVTLEKFVQDFQSFASKSEVLAFFNQATNQLLKDGLVVKETHVHYMLSINRLKKFEIHNKAPLLFADLNGNSGNRIYRFGRENLVLSHNTAVGLVKHYKKFLRLAKEANIKFDEQAFKVVTRYQPGFFEALDMEELKRLRHLFTYPENLTDMQHESLRKSLFSCYTGLRISDSKKVHSKNFSGNRLDISIAKGASYIGKKLQLDLPDAAMELIKGRKGLVFKTISDVKVNKALKKIAELSGIEKRLTFHVARNTFGTILVELGCDPFNLKDFLGHSSVTVTQNYVKAGNRRKENILKRFDSI